MKLQLQAELFRRYPKLFRQPGKRLVDPEVISEFEERLQDDQGQPHRVTDMHVAAANQWHASLCPDLIVTSHSQSQPQ